MIGVDAATEHAWALLGGDAEAVGAVEHQHVDGVLPARLPVRELARATVGVCSLAATGLPAEGVRVLDLTRVIAGPVATRTLGFLGADVLRIDSPALPPDDLWDTGFGKRSALRDLRVAGLDDLLERADVVVTGYLPGALDRFGR